MYRYVAFNLGVCSEILLPELISVSPSIDADRSIDIEIRLGNLEETVQASSNQSDFLKGQVEKVGTFLIRDGREIKIDPLPDVDPSLLRTILLGPVLCVLLRQRGLFVLHASSVAIKGSAIAFLAPSGWGKSTLAEIFHSKGYDILTDDVMALEMDSVPPLVLPSLPQIKLWPESATFAGHTLEDLPHLYRSTEKRSHRLSEGFLQTPLPLKRLYILANGTHPEVIVPSLQEIFVELVRHSRAITLLNTNDYQKTHLHHCTSLIEQVSIRRLQRLLSLEALPDLVKLIEADLAELEDTTPACKSQIQVPVGSRSSSTHSQLVD